MFKTQINIVALVAAHRLSVWAVISGFVAACTHIYVALAVIPFHMYCAFRVGRAVQINTIALVAIIFLMLVPVVNTLALLILNNKAARVLKLAGITIGTMGFKREVTQQVNYSLAMLEADSAKKANRNIVDQEKN